MRFLSIFRKYWPTAKGHPFYLSKKIFFFERYFSIGKVWLKIHVGHIISIMQKLRSILASRIDWKKVSPIYWWLFWGLYDQIGTTIRKWVDQTFIIWGSVWHKWKTRSSIQETVWKLVRGEKVKIQCQLHGGSGTYTGLPLTDKGLLIQFFDFLMAHVYTAGSL